MLECLSLKSLNSSSTSASVPNLPPPSQSQGNSTGDTSATSTGSSSTPNVSREYLLAVQTNSYNEIRSKIQGPPRDQVHFVDGYADDDHDSQQNQQILAQVLHPGRESVQEALGKAKPTTFTRLVSTYFRHSETTSRLCLLLHRSVCRARAIYAPLIDLLCVLPTTDCNSVTQSLGDRALDVFLEFDSQDNPFASHDCHNFSHIHSCFSELKQQLDTCHRKSWSRIRLLRCATAGSALCFVVTAVGMVAATVVVTTHAIVAFAAAAAAPACTAYIPNPKNTEKKEVARLKQLNAAAKGAYVLNNDLDTIDRLVARLHTAVEGDKFLVRLGLERSRDRYPIQEVLKQLRKNHQNFLHQLEDLEEHIYLCLNTVNRARSLLLQEIRLHQTF